jgi:hypothetical protein
MRRKWALANTLRFASASRRELREELRLKKDWMEVAGCGMCRDNNRAAPSVIANGHVVVADEGENI